MNTTPKLLGIAGSLRNARWGAGNKELIEKIKTIQTKEELFSFLKVESELHLDNFLKAGRTDGKDFEEIYKNLKKNAGNKGLSNSETALAAGLWSAYQYGTEIDHLSLSEYFDPFGKCKKPDELKKILLNADGYLISGPVYFGDRGSLTQNLIDFIRSDRDLKEGIKGKTYAGLAVGAKRNGGQETTLIYQLLDFVGLGLLGLGNDSDTTSQYGGTGHAGDVGTMHADTYGLDTSMGTGRRIGSVLKKLSRKGELKGKLNVLALVLQDSNNIAEENLSSLLKQHQDNVNFTIINLTKKTVQHCIACDLCPTHIDVDNVYRCIIKGKADSLKDLHTDLLNYDAIIPVVANTVEATNVVTNYQNFIERTRYLRRGDYVFSNLIVAPFILEEVGSTQYMGARLFTSMIRHHTIMTKPIITYLNEGKVLNSDLVFKDMENFIKQATRTTIARVMSAGQEDEIKYRPIGYILSADKDAEDERLQKRSQAVKDRNDRLIAEKEKRIQEQ